MRARSLAESPASPRRERAERVVAAVQEPRAHRRAGRAVTTSTKRAPARYAGLGDRDEQLPVLGLAVDDERVALPDAERGPHDRVGVARERRGWEERFVARSGSRFERLRDRVVDEEVAVEARDLEGAAGLEAGRGETEAAAVGHPRARLDQHAERGRVDEP